MERMKLPFIDSDLLYTGAFYSRSDKFIRVECLKYMYGFNEKKCYRHYCIQISLFLFRWKFSSDEGISSFLSKIFEIEGVNLGSNS
jgi:hypothetical protein